MIKGQNAVLDYFDLVNGANDGTYKFFSIFKRGTVEKGNAIISTPSDNDWTLERAKDLLSRWLGMQQYGEFTIIVNDNEKASARGSKRQDFIIDPGMTMNAPAVSGPPAITPEMINDEVSRKVTEILDKREKERQLVELQNKVGVLEKENRELTKQASDPWNKVISGIEPYVPDILKDMGILRHTVAGIPQTEAKPLSAEDQAADDQINARSEAAFEKIIKARPSDWLELLELLANALEKNPSLGDKVKMFI